jgi:hypothetical protein
MRYERGAPQRAALLITTIAVTIGLTACGSSDATSTTKLAAPSSASSHTRAGVAACLKQHGVSLPSGVGGGRAPGTPPAGGSGGGTTPSGASSAGGPGGGSKLQAALKTCGASFRPGNFRPSTSTGSFRALVVKYAACVRQHGYQLPSPNFSGHGVAVFSRTIETSAKFKAASESCQSLIGPAASAGPPSGAQG